MNLNSQFRVNYYENFLKRKTEDWYSKLELLDGT
jgi:hypothetical protein